MFTGKYYFYLKIQTSYSHGLRQFKKTFKKKKVIKHKNSETSIGTCLEVVVINPSFVFAVKSMCFSVKT